MLPHTVDESADRAEGPDGVALIDHDTFEVIEPWEADRGPQFLAYDVWWHLKDDTLITSEWATPLIIENRLNPEDLLGRKSGTTWTSGACPSGS